MSQANVTKAQDALTKAVTVWTNKSPPYEFKWKEVLPPGNTFSASDSNVTALVNAIVKSRSLYEYKTFKVTDTSTWEPNVTRTFKGMHATEDIMAGMVRAFVDGITTGMNSLKTASTTIWDVVKGLPKNVIDNLKTNMDLVKAKGAAFGTALKDYGTALKNHIMDIIEAVKTDIGAVKDYILAWVDGLVKAILADAVELQSYVINTFNSFTDWVKTNIATLVTSVKAEFTSIKNAIVKGYRTRQPRLARLLPIFGGTVEDMVAKVKAEAIAGYNKLKTEFEAGVAKVKADFEAAYKTLMDSYNKLVASLTATVDIVKKQGEILTDNIKKVTDIRAAYEKFVQDTGLRFSTIEEKMKSMGAGISLPTSSSSGEKKGLFASLFSGAKRKLKHGLGVTYPPAASPPVVQYPYAYPGAPRVYGTPMPWYDYPYTEVDMPAIDFEKEPASSVAGFV
jgi:hypothetical protein